jgi:predicted nucleic acid-binding protein
MRAYVDADVLIWHLRGEPKARGFLRSLAGRREYELWIGAMQRAEIVFFMRPSEEGDTLRLLSEFKTAPVDEAVIDEAGRIYRKWHRSHGIDPNDAILAATARNSGGKIYCLNARHYPMPDLVVEAAW